MEAEARLDALRRTRAEEQARLDAEQRREQLAKTPIVPRPLPPPTTDEPTTFDRKALSGLVYIVAYSQQCEPLDLDASVLAQARRDLMTLPQAERYAMGKKVQSMFERLGRANFCAFLKPNITIPTIN
ncbi:MAG TPA: hypothetical protein VE200_08830 [Xanthobacteraceae bacterium]|nr:hypothetical protein [Xanthobacteraceae bacterium]